MVPQENMYFNTKEENSRLDEIQAAVLSVKLKHLDKDNKRRKEIGAQYIAGISNPSITLPTTLPDEENVFHIFPILCEQRDKLQEYLKEHEVQTLIHYPIPPHKQECYKEWNEWSFPISEMIHAQELSLPISPVMTDEEVKQVIAIINQFPI